MLKTTTSNNTYIGKGSGQGNYGGSNTGVGAFSLYSWAQTTTNNIGIGYYAGFYETGSNKLFIDAIDRSNEADARTKSLIYGVMAAAAANQKLTVNAILNLSQCPIYANNAAARAGGLVTGDLYRTGADPDVLCITHDAP
jgi:hypothetical protein